MALGKSNKLGRPTVHHPDSKSNQKKFFKETKTSDVYLFAGRVPNAHFVITGPCQLVIKKRKGNWFYLEALKDKSTKIIKASKNAKLIPPKDEEL